MKTTTLLIRHGQSEANLAGVFGGQIDPDLIENGMRQAEITAKFIEENYKVDAIYASDLTRAYKTGACLAARLGLPIQKEKDFREIFGGEWENKQFSDLPALYPADFAVWKENIGKARCTGGEAVEELGARVFSALSKIERENRGKTVAIATHATPIRALLSIVETGSTAKMQEIPWVSNASVTVLEYDGEWHVAAASLDEHLKDLRTDLPKTV